MEDDNVYHYSRVRLYDIIIIIIIIGLLDEVQP